MKQASPQPPSKRSRRGLPQRTDDPFEDRIADPPEFKTVEEDVRFSSGIVPPSDPAYMAELQFNGYEDIEDYDNNAFDLNVEKKRQLDPEEELNFDDRREIPNQDDEENPIHQQER